MPRPTEVRMGQVTIRQADGPFKVLRHGGRRGDVWRVTWYGVSCETARTQYINTHGTMRQGGVRLVDAVERVLATDWAPRARSRW